MGYCGLSLKKELGLGLLWDFRSVSRFNIEDPPFTKLGERSVTSGHPRLPMPGVTKKRGSQ
jgi:hypothetical protein